MNTTTPFQRQMERKAARGGRSLNFGRKTMRKVTELECETDSLRLGYLDPENEEWISLEDDDAEQQIKELLKRPDAQEIILRTVIDFSAQLRDCLNKDFLDLYERSEAKGLVTRESR